MNRLFLVLIVSLFVNFETVFSQEKYEKEKRVHVSSVPATAIEFINQICVDCKVKWYLEEGLKSKSIEAKFKVNKSKYSIEFDTFGIIEDAEVDISMKILNSAINCSIKSYLSKTFNKYKIQKIQIQYTGDKSYIINKLKNDINSDNLIIKYELIIRCSNEKETALYEFLFNDKGIMESKSEIIFKPSSHLEY